MREIKGKSILVRVSAGGLELSRVDCSHNRFMRLLFPPPNPGPKPSQEGTFLVVKTNRRVSTIFNSTQEQNPMLYLHVKQKLWFFMFKLFSRLWQWVILSWYHKTITLLALKSMKHITRQWKYMITLDAILRMQSPRCPQPTQSLFTP